MTYYFTPVRIAIINKINKQVLARMWRKGNPSALLVGMQIWCSHCGKQYGDTSKSKKWNCLVSQ